MPAGYPGGQNTFLPSHEATGGLLIGYSRNVEDFPLNKYMHLVPVAKDVGAYAIWTSRQAARIPYDDGRNFLWVDGQDAPHGRDNLESFQYETYRCQRFLVPFTLGDLAVQQADWPVLNAHSKMAAQQMMTMRTRLALKALADYSWGDHEISVNNNHSIGVASGVGWDNGTSSSKPIMKTLNYCAQVIHRDTIGGVKPNDLILVVGPDLARRMSESDEVHEYLKESPFAKDRLGWGGNTTLFNNARYGLPDQLYGYNIIVEDTPVVTSKKGASSDTVIYDLGSDEAYFLARPGGLVGVEGGPNFSTLHGFFKEEFTVEMKQDPDNRRTQGRIISHFEIKVVNRLAGIRLINILSDDSTSG